MNRKAMGKNIRKRLIDAEMTQHELAEKVGLTDVTVSRYLNGQRQPTAYALYRISKALRVSMEYLMQGVE